MPIRTHTVKNPQGKIYTYRRKRIDNYFSEDEIKIIESVYNYIKSTKHQAFSDRERSTLSKFAKAVVLKYCKRFKERYMD